MDSGDFFTWLIYLVVVQMYRYLRKGSILFIIHKMFCSITDACWFELLQGIWLAAHLLVKESDIWVAEERHCGGSSWGPSTMAAESGSRHCIGGHWVRPARGVHMGATSSLHVICGSGCWSAAAMDGSRSIWDVPDSDIINSGSCTAYCDSMVTRTSCGKWTRTENKRKKIIFI